MMRELGTVSPVVWPAWCYSGEGQSESDSTPTATEPNHQQQTSATPTTAAATPPSSTVSPTKTRGKRRNNSNPTNLSSVTMNGGSDVHNNNNNNNNNSNSNNNDEVKTERLSPASTAATLTATTTTTTAGAASAITPDNASSSSRSATPSSSYPGTPPGLAGADRGASPSSLPGGHIKHMEQMMSRNYSDFMRSLAAKYNNSNPNESYFSGTPRNGFPVNLDPRFSPFKTETTPFISLMGPLGPTTATMPSPVHKNNHIASGSSSATTVVTPKDSLADMSHDKKPSPSSSCSSSLEAQQQALYASFTANPFGGATTPSLFPPLIDMSSTQALLNMVRTANAHNAASQLETYLKTTNKRPTPSESSPLDLSSAAVAPTYLKKSRTTKSLSVSESLYGDSLLHIPMVDALRTSKERLGKRYGSVSPKPPSRLGGSGGSSAGSSPRLLPPSTATSLNATTPHPVGRTLPCLSMCGGADRTCGDNNQALASWGVEDVCNFLSTIDICAEYAPNFREQRIDGSGLPLLTEDHLTGTLGMKLGPALKLRATLARRLGHCSVCQHCVHCHVTSVPTASVSPTQTPLAVRPNSTGN